ncbi:hypothetical protein N9N28_12390 [Rubripirellula amarantea]|nr:hypothetical protein [Rubripirellula amarantea]
MTRVVRVSADIECPQAKSMAVLYADGAVSTVPSARPQALYAAFMALLS